MERRILSSTVYRRVRRSIIVREHFLSRWTRWWRNWPDQLRNKGGLKMFPVYSTFMIARQEREEQIKKAAYQRSIRSITNHIFNLNRLLASQKGIAVKQFITFFVVLTTLVVVLAGCGGSEAVAEAKPAQPESGEVAAALPK